jgi:hypothetical protein
MTKRSDKVLKRKNKKLEHEKYLKSLFNKYGWGLNLTSKREAPGNSYWDKLQALRAKNENL